VQNCTRADKAATLFKADPGQRDDQTVEIMRVYRVTPDWKNEARHDPPKVLQTFPQHHA
jgi:hypothetical protein